MFEEPFLLNQMVNFSHFVIFSCSLFSFNAKLTFYFLIILRTLQRLLNLPVSYKLCTVWDLVVTVLDRWGLRRGRWAVAPALRPVTGSGAAPRASPRPRRSGVWLTCRSRVFAARTPAALRFKLLGLL